MSDWGAVHDVSYAAAGLDQESGSQLDGPVPLFDEPLKSAIASGAVPPARLADMTHRILRSMFAAGLFDHPPVITPIDFKSDGDVAQRDAEEGMVLLKNARGLLPLGSDVKRIAVIGGHAESGVLSGAGSSQVIPAGGRYLSIPLGGEGFMALFRTMVFHPSAPLAAIRAKAPSAEVRFDDGRYLSSAVALAKWADVVIVFGNQWMVEGTDAPDLSLPEGQDQLIGAVTAANPKTVVVLETGGPVSMPWLDKAGGVLEAWYPGARGGDAIANVLFGSVDPSGHLPITFPKDIAQNPRPVMPGTELAPGTQFDVHYDEGSDVGYRWFAKHDETALFAFGYGLSYTEFAFKNLSLQGGTTLTASFDVTNIGKVPGAAVPQVYLTSAAGKSEQRLIGFARVMLAPGEMQHVSVTADPRLLAQFDAGRHAWRVDAGKYDVMVGRSAADSVLDGSATVAAATIKP
jgi:beta-glucosidase